MKSVPKQPDRNSQPGEMLSGEETVGQQVVAQDGEMLIWSIDPADLPGVHPASHGEESVRQGSTALQSTGITMQEAVALAMGTGTAPEQSRSVQARVLCSELVEIRWMRLDGCTESTVANMEEIWRTGATLDAEVSLPEGAVIRLRYGSDSLEARVLYCQQNPTGYTLGIQFAGASFWTPERFLPAHAVELGALGKTDQEMPGDAASPADPGGASSRTAHSPGTGSGQRGLHSLTYKGLTPLISRGSLVALKQQFAAEQPA